MKRRVLVTGGGGFIGGHLVALLSSMRPRVKVVSLDLAKGPPIPRVAQVACDLMDRAETVAAIHAIRPTHCVHAAAILGSGCDDNPTIARNVYEALLSTPSILRTIDVGSAATFGWTGAMDCPIEARRMPRPDSAYGRSKLLQEMEALAVASRGLHVVRVRAFNVLGPGQPGSLMPAAFIDRVLAGDPADVPGHRDVRDFLDVRDLANALRTILFAKNLASALFLVGGGQGIVTGALALACLAALGKAAGAINASEDRPPSWSVADSGPLRKLGWRPTYSLADSLRDQVAALDL